MSGISFFIILFFIVYILIPIVVTIYFYTKEQKERQRQMRDYVPPEGTEYGFVVGYKKLIRTSKRKFVSPKQRGFNWETNVWVFSDEIPEIGNTNGIYLAKEPFNKVLSNYDGVTVEVFGHGYYVEHDDGYRVHRARIVKVLEDG